MQFLAFHTLQYVAEVKKKGRGGICFVLFSHEQRLK